MRVFSSNSNNIQLNDMCDAMSTLYQTVTHQNALCDYNK